MQICTLRMLWLHCHFLGLSRSFALIYFYKKPNNRSLQVARGSWYFFSVAQECRMSQNIQVNRTIVLLPIFNFHFPLFHKMFPDCFQSIFFLINYPSMGDGLCKVMAIFGILSAVASFIWTVMISHYIWRIVTSPFGCPSGYFYQFP